MVNDPQHLTGVAGRKTTPRRRSPKDARPSSLDWPAWVNLIERQRRLAQRNGARAPLPDDYFIRATCASFGLDGIISSEQEVIDALTRSPSQRKLRSRSAQRIRNHIAILQSVEKALRLGYPLKSANVIRWYTSIGGGLSNTELSAERIDRLSQIIERMNSPQLRLQPALQEILQTYNDLLSDPLFPSFNGILSRLLLRYHLGRCGLPFVVFQANEPEIPTRADESPMMKLLTAIDQSYQRLLT
ncbi:MAG TPA: hypothetical protein VHD56_10885 [Tepidisphaeraceae bacterium]|nr:hypothetical protein [Tepidisphaeraceae bacterium]